MDICTRVTGVVEQNGMYRILTDAADLMVVFLSEEVVRIRASFDREFSEASYVLMKTAWKDRLDPLFSKERTRVEPLKPAFQDLGETLCFDTKKVSLVIEKDPLCIKLYDAVDNVLVYSSIPGISFTKDSNSRVTAYSAFSDEDFYYGFGEKAGELNKSMTAIRERATDALAYDPEREDTLYKHIPFYICLHKHTQKAIGVFYHNFFESEFNVGKEKSNYWPRYSFFRADGGDLDLFLLAGGTIGKVLDLYTELTGRPFLLPKRALGYQGSSMYYPELPKDCDRAVLEFVNTVKEEGFPIDGFHLSSGYTTYDGKRCVFWWNKERFSDPAGYFREMNEKGAQNVPNIKPGILLMHPYFSQFDAEKVFVRDSKDPSKNAVGAWWGGPGSFFDFTNPKAREVWKNMVKEHLVEVGTNSIWNDNNEYDSLIDQDAICDYDGFFGAGTGNHNIVNTDQVAGSCNGSVLNRSSTIAALKPIMATMMNRTGIEAVLANDPNARPYMVSRSGSAGIQRYAQTWCGDNHTDWNTLRYNIPMIMGMGLSGQPNEGADIGGFAGPAPTEELFVRWVQNGIFQPRFSIHSASSDNTVTEPWMFSSSAELIRQTMLLRYRFLPYLYSLEYEASQNGAPIMRPLVYEFQYDPKVYDESFEFMFGSALLVANVLSEGVTTQRVYLPEGTVWYDWNDNFRRYEGGQTIEVPVTMETIPMFLREGAILPMAGNQPMSMEKDPVTELKLIVVPERTGGETEKVNVETGKTGGVSEYTCGKAGSGQTFVLYDDDGITNDYQTGVYKKTVITMESGSKVTLDFRSEGSFEDHIETIIVDMIAKEKAPYGVWTDDTVMTHYLNRKHFEKAEEGWYYSQTKRTVEVKYKNPKKNHKVTVSFEQFDLIGM